jgi:hypothetical protein
MGVVGMLVMIAASSAQADETRAVTTAVAASGSERGYGYVFTDDPLNAGQFGSNTAIIKVRHRGGHATLIRPRVQFVSEMLKSVENL